MATTGYMTYLLFIFTFTLCTGIVTLKLIFVAVNTSLLSYILNMIVCDVYKSWLILNPLLTIGSKGRYLIHSYIHRFFVGFCCCKFCYLNIFFNNGFKTSR